MTLTGKTERSFYIKLRGGKSIRIVREQYLRDDVTCHSPVCQKNTCITQCNSTAENAGSVPCLLPKDATHYVIPTYEIASKYLEILQLPEITGVIFLQSIVKKLLQDVGRRSYKSLLATVRDTRQQSHIFLNELHSQTSVFRGVGESVDSWLKRATFKAATWYVSHLKGSIPVIIVTEDQDFIKEYQYSVENLFVMNFKDYLEAMWSIISPALDLYDSITATLALEADHSKDSSHYSNHLSIEVLEAKVANGELVGGFLRVNKHRAQQEAFITATCPVVGGNAETEILIVGLKDRNRAIHGDEVAVRLLPRIEWKGRSRTLTQPSETSSNYGEGSDGGSVMPTGVVVGILQRRWRDYVVSLPEEQESMKPSDRVLVIPYDRRIPKIRIAARQADRLHNQRFIVRIDGWDSDSNYPYGHYIRTLGPIGDLETEMMALLIEHEVPYIPFSKSVLAEMPSSTSESPWQVDEAEVSRRKDLRNTHLIFSIDPEGCQDIDDALSVRVLPDGFELGVHIADVTFFVPPASLTDRDAQSRGTTVYLVDRRFDMLPSVLSSDLCSLWSNKDRYAVSVLWQLDHDFRVKDVWFGRSVIKSSYKLSYEVAQNIAYDEKSPEELQSQIPELKELDQESLQTRLSKLKTAINQLMSIADILRQRRLQHGALELDSVEVQCEFDDTAANGRISTLSQKERLEIHKTVAECMIFANHWVAKRISEAFPHNALLRLHPPPNERDLEELRQCASARNFSFSAITNKQLADSLALADDPDDPAVNQVLRFLATHAMSPASYFSTGSYPEESFYHYGLGLDKYTHFTSPIRRYADVLVHRLLLAINEDGPKNYILKDSSLQECCDHLNKKNRGSKHIQRASAELMQAFYFRDKSSDEDTCVTDAIIYSLRPNGIIAFAPKYAMKGAVCLQRSKEENLVAYVTLSEGVQWVPGTLVQQEKEVVVVTPEGTKQHYRLLDHITVRVKVESFHSHAPAVVFELVSNEAIKFSQTADKERVNVVQEVKEEQNAKYLQDCNSNTNEQACHKGNETEQSFYSLILKMKEMSLRSSF